MKFKSAAVHAGEEVAAQPGNQNGQRAKAEREERSQKDPPMMETALQQPAIGPAESLEGCLKALLKLHQWIATGRVSCCPFLSAPKGFCPGRHQLSGGA